MRDYRRFELHKGNKEKFWEIKRYDKTLYFKEGNIKRKAGEKDPTVKAEEKKDFRVAQLAYDKEIQRKLALGFVEVQQASAPSEEIEFQAIRLESLDDQHTLELSEAEASKILNFMVDRLVVNRRAEILDISKWTRRTLHRTDFKSFDDIDPLSAEYRTLFDKWLSMSKRDRGLFEDETVALYKFTDPQYWIISEKECLYIAQEIQSEIDKRRTVLDESDKVASTYFKLKERWLNFHRAARAGGGYRVVPCSLQFHSTKHGHRFFMDMRSWNDIYNTLNGLDIWDHSAPTYQTAGFESIEEHLIANLLAAKELDAEPDPLPSDLRTNLVSQLLTIADEINDAYRLLLKEKKNNKAHLDAVLMEHGFKWNATNLKKLITTLSSMDDDAFTEHLSEFYFELVDELTETLSEEVMDEDIQDVINEILNDACHLLNHTHQNIHNTDAELLPSGEDEVGDVLVLGTIEHVIAALEDLYPNIGDVEFTEDVPAGQTYTHRPSGLDDELMGDWLHLLTEAGTCIHLLKQFHQYAQERAEIMSEYKSARAFAIEYIEMELDMMGFQSELASMRRKSLAAESDKPGFVLMHKLTDLSEPWILTPTELSAIIEAIYHVENAPPTITKLMTFFNKAADADGCTLLNTLN